MYHHTQLHISCCCDSANSIDNTTDTFCRQAAKILRSEKPTIVKTFSDEMNKFVQTKLSTKLAKDSTINPLSADRTKIGLDNGSLNIRTFVHRMTYPTALKLAAAILTFELGVNTEYFLNMFIITHHRRSQEETNAIKVSKP